jgi:hemerythrin-like domain-containing protein
LVNEHKAIKVMLSIMNKIAEEVVGHGVHEQFHELLNKLKSKYFV